MTKTHEKHGDSGYIADQRAFFDELITADWETYNNPVWDRNRQAEVVQIMKCITTPTQILDVGCGVGYHDLLFANYAPVEKVIGTDYSEKSIEKANQHYPHPKVERFVADILDDAYVSQYAGKFNLVTSFQVIEHLEDAEDFLRRCARLCVDNGYVAVVTPNYDRIQNRYFEWRGSPRTFVDPLHFQEFGVDQLITMGQSLNLKKVGYFGHSMQFSIRGFTLVAPQHWFGYRLGQLFPKWATVIGVVFQKSSQRK